MHNRKTRFIKNILISIGILLLLGCATDHDGIDIPKGYDKPAYSAPHPPNWTYSY